MRKYPSVVVGGHYLFTGLLNTQAYELLGFKSTVSLIYGKTEFFVRLLLLRCFHWDVFL